MASRRWLRKPSPELSVARPLDTIDAFKGSFPAKVPARPSVNHAAGQRGEHHFRPVRDGRLP
jgi:hypothetical protein